ncbi:zinc finger MIZ domain-containing protein [Microdochium nivale]|nr:zinc finger MIZ domain-containing protein [Microdochium nivale]
MNSLPPHNQYSLSTTAATQEAAYDSPTTYLDIDPETTLDISQSQHASSHSEENNNTHTQLTSDAPSTMSPIPIDPRILDDILYQTVPYDPDAIIYTGETSTATSPSPSSDPVSSPPPTLSTSTTAAPPSPPRPRRWKWQCHRCHRRVPATTGRCLCGHRRCSSRSTPEERSSNSDHKDRIRKRYRDSAPRFGRPGEQFYCKADDERWRTRLLEILETDGDKVGTRRSRPSRSALGETARGTSESVNTTATLPPTATTQDSTPRSSPSTVLAQQSTQSVSDTNTGSTSAVGTTAASTSDSRTGRNKRKRAAKEEKTCTVSFDFARWRDYGEWRRAEKRARLVREMDAESDAQEAWAKAHATATSAHAAAAAAAAVVVAAATAAAAAAEAAVTAAIQDDTGKAGEISFPDQDGTGNEHPVIPDEQGEYQETHQSRRQTTTTTTTNSYLDTLFLRDDSPPSEFDELFGILTQENDTEHESAAAAGRLFLRDDSPAYAPGLFGFTEEELEPPQPQPQQLLPLSQEQGQDKEQKGYGEYDPESPPFSAPPAVSSFAPVTPAPEHAALPIVLPTVLPPRPSLRDWRGVFAHDCTMDCDYPGQCRRKRRSEGAEKAYHDGVVEKSRAAFRK